MSPRSIRLLVMVSVLGVLLAGLVAGYTLSIYRDQQLERSMPSAGRPRPPRPAIDSESYVARRLERLSRRLDLSEAQRAAILKILSDGNAAARATIDRVRPQLQTIRAEIEAAITAELTEEQRARYLTMDRDRAPPGRSPPHVREDAP